MMRFLSVATLTLVVMPLAGWAQQQPLRQQQNQHQQVLANNGAPFAPLNRAQQTQLQQFLLNWQKQSQGTKTLECKFTRWHFDHFAAPPGIHASKAEGVVKYAAPDKGLFRVDQMFFYSGMKEGKPDFKEQAGRYGEHWICNGKELIEFDREKEECKIQELPPNLQGKQIFNSPLPFVFNLNAQEIQQRYWVRLVDAGNPKLVLVEAWPKRKEDRAQYKLVQIVLDAKSYTPNTLIIYPPNFHKKNAPAWDHYEFTEMKRNAIGARLQQFTTRNFIPRSPPANWKIHREKFIPFAEPPAQQAANPGPQGAVPATRR